MIIVYILLFGFSIFNIVALFKADDNPAYKSEGNPWFVVPAVLALIVLFASLSWIFGETAWLYNLTEDRPFIGWLGPEDIPK